MTLEIVIFSCWRFDGTIAILDDFLRMKRPPTSIPLSESSPSRDWQNWRRLVQFLMPYRLRFGGAIFFALLLPFSNVLLLKLVPAIFDTVFPPSRTALSLSPSGKFNPLHFLDTWTDRAIRSATETWNSLFTSTPSGKVLATLVLLLAVMFLRAFSDYMSTYWNNWVGVRIITDIRQRVFEHIQKLSLDFFNKANVGDLISRLVHDAQQAQSGVTTVIADAIKHPVTIVMMGSLLILQDWKFSLASIVLAPLCILPIAIYGRKVRRASKLAQQNQGEILSCLHENITGVRIVKGFSMEPYETAKFWETSYRQFSYQMRIVRSVIILSPMIELIAYLGICAAFLYAYRNGMSAGDFTGRLLTLYFLYDPIKNLSKLHTTIQKSLASTDRIFAILDVQSSVEELPSARAIPAIRNEIRIENVSFRYDSHEVLRGVDLVIPHGKSIALVGASGAGKSTLLSLIPRFYDPTDGCIRIDGEDIRDATFDSLRKQMAIVTQDTILFNDTIGNNIRYGSMNASEEQIIQAAKRAYAHDFILQQPQGYDTIVGEKGVKLSGGQKQRLAIARAILRNPSILLLDEATSALDTESERFVQAALDELIEGRTVIVIAHRLSTVQKADLIVVMERGRIVEQGGHEELLSRGQLYRKLHDLQFQEA